MKTFLIILVILFNFNYTFAQPGNQKVNEFINFLSPEIGWLSTGGSIFRTTNGGESWYNQRKGLDSIFISMKFVTDSVGFALGDVNHRNLSKTTNQGETWEFISTGFNDYSFIDELNGYGIDGAYLYKSEDGGYNWDTLPRGILDDPLQYLWVISPDIIYLMGAWKIYKSVDGGYTWVKIFQLGPPPQYADYWFDEICFADSNIGYIYFQGDSHEYVYDALYKTIDGGVNWDTSTWLGKNIIFYDSIGFMQNFIYLLKTTNKGETWDSIYQFSTSLTNFTFIDELNGFSWDFENYEFGKTIDGGYTWNHSIANLGITYQNDVLKTLEYSLEQNYPNPFNPSTNIKFSLPEGGITTIKVYDILGEEKEIILNEYKQAGSYTATFDGENLPSGVYIYTITRGSFKQSRKMVLMK